MKIFGLAAAALVAASSAMADDGGDVRHLIDDGVFEHYTRDQHPKTFAAYGDLVILGPVQLLREEVAIHAARQRDCGKVLWSEFSTNKSRPNKWVVFADCESGMRYYLDWDGGITSEKNAPLS